jgi:2'-5' RNA ligase
VRLFVAAPIQPEICINLDRTINVFKKTGADIKWVKPESIHITLKFLGETDEEKINNISDVLSDFEKQKGKLITEVKGIGFFPDSRRPRIIWAGLEEKPVYLAELASIMDAALSKLSFEKEKRAFSPHITIGRFRSNRSFNYLIKETDKMKTASFGIFEINEFNLYSSTLKPSGAEYKILRSFKL